MVKDRGGGRKMFRSARWRSEKNKIKSVFKLQFHATQVAQTGVDALILSVIPADVGKPTAKLEKATVRDGCCYWENAVLETVKFDQEAKSGKIHERIYRFVVATGSSKTGVIGEASIDFSNYAESTKVSSVSLPLKNSKSDILLHVSIQKLPESGDQIETFKDNVEVMSNGDMDDGNIMSNTIPQIGELNSNRRTSSGSDVTMSSSDCSSVLDTPTELQLKNRIHQDSDSALAIIIDEQPPTVIEKLRAEVITLARQAEVSELELQTLRKQIVKEGKKGQDLSKEVMSLKKERDSLREDCEKLKGFQKHLDEAKSKHTDQLDGGDFRALIEEIRQELDYEKELNANLRIEVQKTQESNSELLLAVQQKNQQILHLTQSTQNHQETNSKCESDDDEEQKALEKLVREHSDAKELYLMEQRIMDLNSEVEIYRREKDDLEVQMEQIALDYEILKQEHHECSGSFSTISELKIYIKDLEDELEKQAQGFEADLEELTRDKVEHEQRAIKAEESLRKTRWQNVNTAERLQGELRRLSVQMYSTFEANEKLASKAMMETSELRMEKDNLRDMLKKSREEVESLKEDYEERLNELSNQVISMSEQLEEMQTEMTDKSLKLENQEKLAEETQRRLSEDILMLKDNKSMHVPYEPEEVAHLEEKIRLLEGQINQKESALETSTNTFLEKEKELQNQIEDLARTLEVLSQKSSSFSESKSEKVAEEQTIVYEYGIATASDSSENNCPPFSPDSNNSTNEWPKNNVANERNDELADEVAQLKEKNKLMEDELKEMQERYSEISLKFAEVEGERQQLVMRVRNLKNARKS